ncbi:Concanavalin A-like lectin/glucanases superfamily protein [Pedobacter sp. ok626]|uniref:LamG-like jellyroll fold domain-containing protein n=1 Tax=Pedobacter sp. ok626 TaxID=1761882 RepID=UPI00088AF8C8|nr:LamG-like jellyroll fold domain-containing protein [Pedobacter sp. ok626]SDK71245.1 Concanavalin A-like lectin/glucanases superfamily protein [Pedobacter sp. ok626]
MILCSIFWFKRIVVLLLALTTYENVLGQAWMPSYNFRKKISIDKSMIQGGVNLLEFSVLIELEDRDLKQPTGCVYQGQNTELDISFASVLQPDIPIHFQLDAYDPLKGKLMCWVRIKELIASGNPGVNELYLYYGSTQRHNPLSAESRATWGNDYQNVWHINPDIPPASSRSANQSSNNDMIGDSGVSVANFQEGKIGAGLWFNGSTTSMHAAPDTNSNVYVTLWLKLHEIGREQVILANDTLGVGFRITIDAEGYIVLSSDFIRKSTMALTAGTWYYVGVMYNRQQKEIYINGVYRGGDAIVNLRMKNIGRYSIGKSKQDDRYFNGMIDELRTLRVIRRKEWLSAEYRNQLNPTAFISVSAQEINPIQTPLVDEFTGGYGTNNWDDEGNWSSGTIPVPYANITIKAGRELRIPAGTSLIVNSLILEPGSRLLLGTDLEVNCKTEIGSSSSIILDEGVRVVFKNDVVNDGAILLNENAGALIFAGDQSLLTFSGSGICAVSRLEVNLNSGTALLQAKLKVSKQVELIKGTLNANGNLTMLATGATDYAVLMPIQNINAANIIGNVTVQQFIDGDFLAPSTARNWWLLSSPVYQSLAEPKLYNLNAIQQSMFVTGTGGINNGFDLSPNNNSTIYTHDQSLPGSLSQKYAGIASMGTNLLMGKGFYVFSRGSRTEPNAYVHQIQTTPFSNPKPYLINYSGKLFTGELKVVLRNRDTGGEGDGYNLLGNPYASTLLWGNLQKVNMSPFLWVFDPKNNAYRVTDDPAYLIHSGAGFFVKVNSGNSTGELTFTEQAKSGAVVSGFSRILSSVNKETDLVRYDRKTRIKITLNKESLSDDYILTLHPSGSNEINDADAAKIGEGHLSISGLATNGNKLSIDERAIDTGRKIIKLFVKGWTTGTYTFKFNAVFNNQEKLTLIDHYLDVHYPIAAGESTHHFSINTAVGASYGKERFSLLLEPIKINEPINGLSDSPFLFYPNPVNELIYLKAVNQSWKNLKVIIRNISAEQVWRNDLAVLEPGIPVQLSCSQLIKGIYILQLIDQKSNKIIASFKILKN